MSTNTKPKRKRTPKADALLTDEEYDGLQTHPEAVRLVNLFIVAEKLSEDIAAYWRDHPASCACIVCRFLRENKASRPTCSDYLIALHAIVRSATATHDELPFLPQDGGTV